MEIEPIPLRSLWTPEGSAAMPNPTTFVLGGIVSLASAPRIGGQADTVWTNALAGVHFLSGFALSGYQTPRVRIEPGKGC